MTLIREEIVHKIIESEDNNTIFVESVGPVGPVGPQGSDGSGGETVLFVQAVPLNPWVIAHNWPGGYPSVTVVDSSGRVVVGDITYNTNTQLTIDFSGSFSGVAYLN